MRAKKSNQLLSEKFVTSMLNNSQLNKIRGGYDNRWQEIPPAPIPPYPIPPIK